MTVSQTLNELGNMICVKSFIFQAWQSKNISQLFSAGQLNDIFILIIQLFKCIFFAYLRKGWNHI